MNINWTQDNVYTTDMWTKAREDERVRGTSMWNKAQNPQDTGVVPKPAYASMFASPNIDEEVPREKFITTLAGEELNQTSFIHNNMQPFFGGRVRQNMRDDANTSRLERYTGRSDLQLHKKEVPSFFEPTPATGNVCGMPNNTDFYIDNIQMPKSRNNDFPVDRVIVGRGLGQGFTADPTGGYQQVDTLDYARPKNVDQLRVATNPRIVYELPVQGPKQGIAQRGILGEFKKNRTEKFFEQTPDMFLKTTGAVIKETGRPFVDVKPTGRVETHIEYQGGASSGENAGQGISDDYGKMYATVKPNERQTMAESGVITNVTSAVKAIIAPLLDIFKHTPKEYTVDSARQYGNMQAQIPEKATIIDPVSGKMRTTIKETGLYDESDLGMPKAQIPEKATVIDPVTGKMRVTIKETGLYDESDLGMPKAQIPEKATVIDPVTGKMRVTIKETGLYDESDLGMPKAQIPEKATVYDPVTGIMRTTIKETLIHDTDIGIIKAGDKPTAFIMDNAKKTVRETLPYSETTRNVNAHTYRVTLYNVDAIAKKTIKETTLSSEMGYIDSSRGKMGAYGVIDVEMPNTQKQFISDYEYEGISTSTSDFRQMSKENIENAEIDPTKEYMNVNAGRTPNAGGKYTGLAPENVDMESKKLLSDDLAPRTVGNISRVIGSEVKPIEACEVTKPSIKLDEIDNRLDSSVLGSLESNPYAIRINPIN